MMAHHVVENAVAARLLDVQIIALAVEDGLVQVAQGGDLHVGEGVQTHNGGQAAGTRDADLEVFHGGGSFQIWVYRAV